MDWKIICHLSFTISLPIIYIILYRYPFFSFRRKNSVVAKAHSTISNNSCTEQSSGQKHQLDFFTRRVDKSTCSIHQHCSHQNKQEPSNHCQYPESRRHLSLSLARCRDTRTSSQHIHPRRPTPRTC